MHKKYEIILFTASYRYYANPIIDYIDPENKLIKHRIFRENCVSKQIKYSSDSYK